MSWFLCMVWNNGSLAARRKKGNFLHTHTKGVILTKDGGTISLCACTGWGWTLVKLGSEFLNSGVRNEPTIGLEAVREGGTHPLPGSCTSPRDLWENKVAWSQSRVPSLSRDPEQRVTPGGSGPTCVPGESPSVLTLMHLAHLTAIYHVSFSFFHQSYGVQPASLWPPWLNLFLGILFLLMQL